MRALMAQEKTRIKAGAAMALRNMALRKASWPARPR